MDKGKEADKVRELEAFLKELKSYKRLLDAEEQLSENQKRYKESLRGKLVRQSGALKGKIIELTGHQYVEGPLTGRFDIWAEAFNTIAMSADRTALAFCIDAVNEAIGKLESTPIAELELQEVRVTEYPKAFIAHGGKSGVLDKLRDFIHSLGIDPLIVELLPSKGMSVDDKVNKYIKDADCGIVLATKGGIIDKKSQKHHPRLNVIDEFERLRAVFPDKTILLLEKGVDLPSNIAGLTYEPFARQSMDRAFTAIARELTAFGILKAVKP